MPLVKYVGNLLQEGTSELLLAEKRVLVLGGDALQVTEEELARLRGKYRIEVVEEEKPSEPISPSPVVPSVSVGDQPAVGSAPRSDESQLPTPPAGN